MFSNFFFWRCRDEDVGPFGLRDAFLRFSRRQQQTADRDVLQGHGNQIFHFERDDLSQFGGIAKREGESSDKYILAGEGGDDFPTTIQAMLPEKISEHAGAMRRLRLFPTSLGKRQMEIFHRFAPRETAAKAHGLKGRFSDIESDTISNHRQPWSLLIIAMSISALVLTST